SPPAAPGHSSRLAGSGERAARPASYTRRTAGANSSWSPRATRRGDVMEWPVDVGPGAFVIGAIERRDPGPEDGLHRCLVLRERAGEVRSAERLTVQAIEESLGSLAALTEPAGEGLRGQLIAELREAMQTVGVADRVALPGGGVGDDPEPEWRRIV